MSYETLSSVQRSDHQPHAGYRSVAERRGTERTAETIRPSRGVQRGVRRVAPLVGTYEGETMTANEAVTKIRALRRLARTTPVMTHKAQYQLLQSLSPEVLAEVAVILEKDENDNDTRK